MSPNTAAARSMRTGTAGIVARITQRAADRVLARQGPQGDFGRAMESVEQKHAEGAGQSLIPALKHLTNFLIDGAITLYIEDWKRKIRWRSARLPR